MFGFRIGRAHIFPWVSQKATKGCIGINVYYGDRITEEGERKPVLPFVKFVGVTNKRVYVKMDSSDDYKLWTK